jgi:hypothetical protein
MPDEILLTRFSLRRKPAADLDAESPQPAEPALETDTGNVRLANADGSSWAYHLLAIPRAGLTEGATFQWRGGQLIQIPRQPAVPASSPATAVSPTLDPIPFPGPAPTDASTLRDDLATNTLPAIESRTDALKAQIDSLIDDNTTLRNTLNTLLTRLRPTSGNGIIND